MPLGGDFKLNIMFCLVCGVAEDGEKAVELSLIKSGLQGPQQHSELDSI